MKATIDNSTPLTDKPRRGRPVTGTAKSQAQIQRDYRQRKKSLGLPTLAQALSGFHVWHLPKGCRKWRQMTDYPLSWDSAHYFVRCFNLAHGLVDSDLPELSTKYEIRPAQSFDDLPD